MNICIYTSYMTSDCLDEYCVDMSVLVGEYCVDMSVLVVSSL